MDMWFLVLDSYYCPQQEGYYVLCRTQGITHAGQVSVLPMSYPSALDIILTMTMLPGNKTATVYKKSLKPRCLFMPFISSCFKGNLLNKTYLLEEMFISKSANWGLER